MHEFSPILEQAEESSALYSARIDAFGHACRTAGEKLDGTCPVGAVTYGIVARQPLHAGHHRGRIVSAKSHPATLMQDS